MTPNPQVPPPLEQTERPDDLLRSDQIALQVWLVCSLLLWLIGLCSVVVGVGR